MARFPLRTVRNRIFGPKWDEVKGEWIRLHNEELYNLCSSSNVIRTMKSRRMRWVGHVARVGDRRGTHRVLVGRSEAMRPLEKPCFKWEDNIKICLQEAGWERMDRIDLAQDKDR